jgi:hypothetical protein
MHFKSVEVSPKHSSVFVGVVQDQQRLQPSTKTDKDATTLTTAAKTSC